MRHFSDSHRKLLNILTIIHALQSWAKYSKYSYSSTILVVLVLERLVLVLEGSVLVHVLEDFGPSKMIAIS